jgi:hypothetical protein
MEIAFRENSFGFGVDYLTAARVASSRIKNRMEMRGWPQKQHPRAAVRTGAAAAFRAWFMRTAGRSRIKGIGLLAGFAGEPIFRKRFVPTVLRKLGAPQTLVAIPLGRRPRARCAKEKKAVDVG